MVYFSVQISREKKHFTIPNGLLIWKISDRDRATSTNGDYLSVL